MRVLHVTDTYLPRRGGIELHVHDLAQAQRRAGDEVDVLTLTRARAVEPAESAGSLLRPADHADLVDKLRFVLAHRRRGRTAGYDVVHAHCSTFSPLVFATLAAADGLPTAVTAHSLWRRYTPLYRAGDYAGRWSTWPIAWSAVSEAAAEAVRRAAARPLQVDVVPNGIDPTAWPHVERSPQPGRLRVISVMRLAPRKRPLALLRILHRAALAMPPGTKLEAVVVGDGPQAGAMRRYLRRHDLEDLVTLAGHQPRPEIARRLADADVFLAPATLESFGIAALEAAATGVPVLGRRRTGLAEFVVDGAGGLLVDSDAGIAEALVDVAAGRRQLGPVPRAAVEQMSWPAVVERTRALYERAGLGEVAPVTGSTRKRRAS
ncbi:MAG TPA: glycosyltransferase family 4 protein [Mycobacteriales bacterium]|nr:glycosyltransferase family 4 protein [Mycobacteriales bacterium]